MSSAAEVFREQYAERTPRSAELYREGRRHLAGGVPGNAGYREPHPLYISEAKGPRIWDVDGNVYVDCLIGGGPNILGHSPSVVMDAVKEQLDHGTNTIAPPVTAIQLAAKIKAHMPHMELLRFVHTGSEAVHMSMRIARAVTGRVKIGKFEGNFHGGYDNLLVSGTQFDGPEDRPLPVPEGGGIPPGVLAETVVLPFNNKDATVRLIEENATELAAVVVEPVGGTWMGGVVADPAFLVALREITEKHGIVLIFDEVITGFRVALGGSASVTGIRPDLVALAKVIGGGFPLGAFGGRRDIMEQAVDPSTATPEKRIFQSGTFQSNLVSLKAGLAMITELEKPGVHDRMTKNGDRIRQALNRLGSDLGLPVLAIGQGPIFGVYFSERPISSLRDIVASDRESAGTFYLGLVANGVYITPYHLGFTNASQTDEDVSQIVDAANHVLKVMRDLG